MLLSLWWGSTSWWECMLEEAAPFMVARKRKRRG
jgi:hypothetical protein